jgi:hypothetical protein
MPPKKKAKKKAKKGTTMSQNVKQSVVVHVNTTKRRQPARGGNRSQPMSRIQTPQFVGTIGQDYSTYEKQSSIVSQAIDNVLKDNILKLKNYPENSDERFKSIEGTISSAQKTIAGTFNELFKKIQAPVNVGPIKETEFKGEPSLTEVNALPKVPSTTPSTTPSITPSTTTSNKPTKKVKIARNTIFNYIRNPTSRAEEPAKEPAEEPAEESATESPKKRKPRKDKGQKRGSYKPKT